MRCDCAVHDGGGLLATPWSIVDVDGHGFSEGLLGLFDRGRGWSTVSVG